MLSVSVDVAAVGLVATGMMTPSLRHANVADCDGASATENAAAVAGRVVTG